MFVVLGGIERKSIASLQEYSTAAANLPQLIPAAGKMTKRPQIQCRSYR
jgi:hypothetical protein